MDRSEQQAKARCTLQAQVSLLHPSQSYAAQEQQLLATLDRLAGIAQESQAEDRSTAGPTVSDPCTRPSATSPPEVSQTLKEMQSYQEQSANFNKDQQLPGTTTC